MCGHPIGNLHWDLIMIMIIPDDIMSQDRFFTTFRKYSLYGCIADSFVKYSLPNIARE